MVGIILCLIGTFLFLMIVIAWIFNLSLEANFIISLVIFIIMFIYYVLKDNNSINKANKLNNFKKNIHLDNLYEEIPEENIYYIDVNNNNNDDDEKRKNIMIDEFIDFFEKENISSDLTINEVKDIIENNGYEINSSLENDALNIAIRKYRGIVFKDKDNIKKEISGILKDLEDKNNIKYFYYYDIANAKKVLQEHNIDMENLNNIQIFEEIVSQYNIDNKDNKIKKSKKSLNDKGEKNMIEIKDNVKIAKELKNKVERIEGFEEQLGITLENISFRIDDYYCYLNINGEIIRNSDECNTDGFYVCAVIYNNDDEILFTGDTWVNHFNGYDAFNIEFQTNEYEINTIKRVRIFVKE